MSSGGVAACGLIAKSPAAWWEGKGPLRQREKKPAPQPPEAPPRARGHKCRSLPSGQRDRPGARKGIAGGGGGGGAAPGLPRTR